MVLELSEAGIAIHRARLEFAMLRKIPFEVRGIHDHAVNDAGKAQFHDAPVVARRSAAPRFPAVHPLADVGVFVRDPDGSRSLQQIFLRRKKFIIGGEHAPAQPLGGKIDVFGEIHQRSPRRKSAPRGVPRKRPRS